MAKWNINYAETVKEWLDNLTTDQLKGVAKELRLLELCGNKLKLPHSKALTGGLFELRERSHGLMLYYSFGKEKEIILIYAGDKKTQNRDIKKARQLLTRMAKA